MSKKVQGLSHDQFVLEAKRLVADLAFFAKRPVTLKLVGGDHIAYTYNTEDKQHPIPVVLNPNCVEGVRNKARAVSILRGIGFHELLHHLHPAEAQYKQANAEGFMSLFNLIDDEQNERRGTSADPSWGAHFQSVCAFIFPTSKRRAADKLNTGIADGGKEEKDEAEKGGYAASEVYRLRWNAFAYHFRRHIPRGSGESGESEGAIDYVARALALIPENFKDLSKEELLNLVRRVHLTLCEGITLPQPKPKSAASEVETPPTATPSGPTQPVKDAFSVVERKSIFEGLLKSKWSYVTLGVIVLGWAALFSQGGSDLWFRVFQILMLVVVVAVSLLGLVKLLKSLKQNEAEGDLKEPSTSLVRRIAGAIKDTVSSGLSAIGGFIGGVFARLVPRRFLTMAGYKIRAFFQLIGRGIRAIKAGYNWLWNQRWFRITLVTIPPAVVLMILWAVFMQAGKLNWWFAVLAVILLLALLILSWIFRVKLADFLIGDVMLDSDFENAANMTPPMDFETAEFNLIDKVDAVDPDQAFLDWALPLVQPLAQALRPVLARVGSVRVDLEDQPVGDDVIDELEQLYLGESNIFVEEESRNAASLHIEVAVDCSSSMNSENATLKRGEKFKLAKLFALVVEEATNNQRGMSSRFWGFTDTTIYDCGQAGEHRISGLKASGGNNDSAMLFHMGQSAAASGKSVKMLFMLSDGQPSDCSWISLRNLVLRFEANGMVPWHFALDTIKDSAFERFFTDLCGQSLDDAMVTMVGILAAIAAEQK